MLGFSSGKKARPAPADVFNQVRDTPHPIESSGRPGTRPKPVSPAPKYSLASRAFELLAPNW